jgi:molybdenum cofactor cytidylyltransferase
MDQYRRRVPGLSSTNVWTLILAAGASSRFGSAKALARWEGGTLLSRAIETAREVSGGHVLIVAGGHAEQIVPALGQTAHIFNPSWAQGMGTSIACGISRIEELDPDALAILLLPVDQPWARAQHLAELEREGRMHPSRCVLTRTGQGQEEVLGPPAFIPRLFFARARLLQEDRGLKHALAPDEISSLTNDAAFLDVDLYTGA